MSLKSLSSRYVSLLGEVNSIFCVCLGSYFVTRSAVRCNFSHVFVEYRLLSCATCEVRGTSMTIIAIEYVMTSRMYCKRDLLMNQSFYFKCMVFVYVLWKVVICIRMFHLIDFTASTHH